MPKVAVYTVAGQQIGDIELNESVFGVEVNEENRYYCKLV